ncbi:MAG: hypothetical protein ACR2F1_11875 [Nitrososphaeraceae archaeon]
MLHDLSRLLKKLLENLNEKKYTVVGYTVGEGRWDNLTYESLYR